MYLEAKPFIEQLELKKDLEFYKFQIFRNDKFALLITGVGKVKAAIAITYLFSLYRANDEDLLINIGVCGAKNQDISIYMNKVNL